MTGSELYAPTPVLEKPREEPLPDIGIVVPDFYVDPDTKVLGCHVRPAHVVLAEIRAEEDRLVAELEAKMRDDGPKTLTMESLTKTMKEIIGRSSFPQVDWAALEMRTLSNTPMRGLRADAFYFDEMGSFNSPTGRLSSFWFDQLLGRAVREKPTPQHEPAVFIVKKDRDNAARLPRVSYIEQFYDPTTGKDIQPTMPSTSQTVDLSAFYKQYSELKTQGMRDPQIAKKLCIAKSTLDDRLREYRRQQKRA